MRDAYRFRATPFLWGALALGAMFAALYFFFVRTYMGQVVDELAFEGAAASRDSVVTFARHFLDVLPVVALGAGFLITLAIVLVRHNWRVFIVAVIAVIGANGSTQLLKFALLSRPHTGATFDLSNSFPSGHTTVAASAALAVFLVSSPRLRPVAAVLGSIFAIVAGTFTLISQWHRPSDVIAGFLVVGFWACLAGCALAWGHTATTRAPARSRLFVLVWIAIAAAIAAIIALIVTYLTARTGQTHYLVAYVGGISAITAVGFALAAAGNRQFRLLT
jgi:membrane-associated phospholipid phosphatase